MIYGKEECKNLVACRAAVLVCDGHTRNGTPIIVVCRVVDMDCVWMGHGGIWFVKLDMPLTNGCDNVCSSALLGTNTGNELDISALTKYINTQSHLPYHERHMLISDAKTRLQEGRI